MLNHARFHSPSLGRLLEPNPIGADDDAHLHAYARNNPLNDVAPGIVCR
ncbi:hypothetical protein ACI6PO_21170 [Agrobacterium tumefaciens]